MELTPINCPYCELKGLKPDNTKNLFRNTKLGVHCFRCGYKGKYKGDYTKEEIQEKKLNIEDVDLFTFKLITKQSKPIYHYLSSRLPPEQIKQIKWSPQLPYRAVFPIYSYGKLVALNARSIYENEKNPKYITLGKKSHYVYRLNHFTDWAVLTEGPFDAHSSPHGIATFGADISETQLALIKNRFKTIFLALDADAENKQEVIYKILLSDNRYCSLYNKVKKLKLPKGTDPNILGYAGMVKLIGDTVCAII